jgi:PA14 domain/Right handed beta helix region/Chondroitinase B
MQAAATQFFESLEDRRLCSASPHGLSATYFNSYDLTQAVVTRVDHTVQFRFGRKPPVAGIGSDIFSVEWNSQLTPQRTGMYTLLVKADDGVRLTVDGDVVIDTWGQDVPASSKVRLMFIADHAYDIQMDYHHDRGASHVALLWNRQGQSPGVIPPIRMAPPIVTAPPSDPVSSTPPTTTAPSDPVSSTPPTTSAPSDPVAPVTPPSTPTAPVTPTTPTAPVAPVTSGPPVVPTHPINNPTSGTIWTVDPVNGPIYTISQAAALAKPGDTVLIHPGTYTEDIFLTTSGTATAPITFEAQTAGTVIIDAAGFTQAISSNFGTTNFINLEGITVQGCNNPSSSQQAAITTGSGWNLTNVTVTGALGTGIEVYGNGVTLTNVAANYCGLAGLSGGGCSNVLVQNCSTIGNNTLGNNPDDDGGAGKWTGTDHVTINGLISDGNTGPGLWFDYNNANVLIENSTIYNNQGLTSAFSGSGIRCELDLGPVVIQNNTFYGNTGPSVQVESCRNFVIENNSFTGSSLTLEDWSRGAAYTMENITIEYNTFNGTNIATEAPNWSDSSAVTKNITMDYDTYINNPSTYIVQWGNQLFNKLLFVQEALGLELHGTYINTADGGVTPLAISV